MIRVKAAFVSLTPPLPADDDGSYLRWHLLDHMPEQYQLPGLVHALRYIADGDYPAARIAGEGPLADIGAAVTYLIGDPVQRTHDDFMELGLRLAEVGRFPIRRPSLQLRMPALLRWYAAPRALVSAEVVPMRPHRGVLLLVEEPAGDDVDGWLNWLHTDHAPALLDVPGVAGAWTFGSTDFWEQHPHIQGSPQYTTVVYLDEDPLAVTQRLTPLIEQRWASGAVRPLFAGPLRSMVRWDAWPE
ncbi:hypothetical protein [Trujillonella endophytica]|uniref:EthD domain-containing protein n=1 Tax=Trujillonella endophytica TaxID=673521 RepID=A0A1H8Q4U5_9ACTN|nr:hypothetical protein [Trujillella endophytica]SEO49038.1 hypothetical protein SAMN05660991_00562 [Trujillella endophytica]